MAALRSVDLRLDEGDFLTLWGPNGAGKTTLIRILATLVRPSQGRVWVAGLDVREYAAEARRLIGVVSHQTLLYGDLTAEENLLLYARLYDLPDERARVRQALQEVGLDRRAAERVRTLSRGLRQRASLARAILHDPLILLCDEPYDGLDPQASAGLTRLLARLAERGRTVLLATHDLAQGLELCNRVAILCGGLLVHEQRGRGLAPDAFRRLCLDLARGAKV